MICNCRVVISDSEFMYFGEIDKGSQNPDIYIYIHQIVQRFFINAVHIFFFYYCFYVLKNVHPN